MQFAVLIQTKGCSTLVILAHIDFHGSGCMEQTTKCIAYFRLVSRHRKHTITNAIAIPCMHAITTILHDCLFHLYLRHSSYWVTSANLFLWREGNWLGLYNCRFKCLYGYCQGNPPPEASPNHMVGNPPTNNAKHMTDNQPQKTTSTNHVASKSLE